jgi:cardiolipin synthase A/B
MSTKSTNVGPYTFYSKPEYYQDLQHRISQTKAGDRVALATMDFDPSDPGVQLILDRLGAAAERGVKASLAIDAYVFLSHEKRGPGPLFFNTELPQYMRGVFRRKFQAIETLRDRGVICVITNKPGRRFTSPVSGRSHIKYAIINDLVYIGGCNLNNAKNIDLMVGWDNGPTADWLYTFALKMLDTESTAFMHGQDLSFTVDTHAQLLVDSGKPKQSIILERALELIDEAQKDILITCQFFPNSITAKRLAAAHNRGVKVSVIYNRNSKHDLPYNVLHYLVDLRERMRTPTPLFANRLERHHHYLHAKLIATEKGTIIGSHNFVAAGVNFGTAEIALLQQNPIFSAHAVDAISKQL